MFQSLGILQHYTKFDTCTITSLEKLLGVGFYGGYINHLSSCHSSCFFKWVQPPFVVWIIARTFLGCSALIVPTLVNHFQHDDHTILLDVVTHVETNIFLF